VCSPIASPSPGPSIASALMHDSFPAAHRLQITCCQREERQFLSLINP
jgi:hypothetical protein